MRKHQYLVESLQNNFLPTLDSHSFSFRSQLGGSLGRTIHNSKNIHITYSSSRMAANETKLSHEIKKERKIENKAN